MTKIYKSYQILDFTEQESYSTTVIVCDDMSSMSREFVEIKEMKI